MARNGSGTYNRLVNPAYVNGTTNDGTELENEQNDIAQALTDSLTANGEKQPTANQPMAGFRHTSVGEPTATNQYATARGDQTNELSFGVTAGTTTAYTVTLPLTPVLTTFPDGMTIRVRAHATNTGAMTLAVNGTTARTVQLNGASVPTGAFVIDRHYDLIYRVSSTIWHVMAMMDAPGLAANNTFTGTNSLTAASSIGGKAGTDIVTGPASATDNAVALYNGVGGKTLKDGPLFTSAAGVADALVQRNPSGYIFNNYYNMSANDTGATVPSRIPVENGSDGYLRWQTWANFRGNVGAPLFTSAETAIPPVNTAATVAHGLGRVPHNFSVVLRCKTAEFGWLVDDEILLANDFKFNGVANFMLTVWASASVVGIHSNEPNTVIIRRDNASAVGVTNANWRLVFRAW